MLNSESNNSSGIKCRDEFGEYAHLTDPTLKTRTTCDWSHMRDQGNDLLNQFCQVVRNQ